MPVFAGSFAAAEAELLLHVAPGWDGTVPADDAGTRALIDEVRIGIEIASSPYPGINADGPPVTAVGFRQQRRAGDRRSARRLAGTRPLRDRRSHRDRRRGSRHATAATMLDGPYGAVRFLLANLASARN